MGSTQSVQEVEDSEEEEDDDEEEDHDVVNGGTNRLIGRRRSEALDVNHHHMVKKVLEQEPEMLPCYASASPLSPQLSTLGTPRLGPSIKVWDPYNVLSQPPPLPPPSGAVFSRSYSMEEDHHQSEIEVFLVSHGESELNLRPDLVGGRCNVAALTPNGKRQARALAVFLNSQGVRFNAVYSSPLGRARSMAAVVCQEMNFSEEQIQTSEALAEMSMGQWEGCSRSEIYSPEILSLIDRQQPDFSAPSGESLRQVEFRMVQFLSETVLGLTEKLRTDFSSHNQNESQGFPNPNSHSLSNSNHDRESHSLQSPNWDSLNRNRQGLSRKKSGKSRLQFVTTDEMSSPDANHQNDPHYMNAQSSPSCVGVFTHSLTIKSILTGILGCSPVMSHKVCIDDSSVTVLQHSWKTGWQIKRLNDTAHRRLL
jgi:broad specificity phosphatase PhoE